MKKLPYLLAALIICATAYAQDSSWSKKHDWRDMPMPTIGFGISFQKFKNLDNRVAGLPQYEGLPESSGTLQLGWLKQKRSLVSVFNIMGGTSFSGDHHKKSSVLRYLGIAGDIGYDVAKQERIMLYPFVGLAYQWYQAKFYTDNSGVEFDDALESPAVQNEIRPVSFRNSFFNYRAGIGAQFISQKGGTIGLQATYTGSFQERAWKGNDNQTLGNSPEDRLSQFSIALILGFKPMMMYH
ncbi:outer membrane beta-barrel protein [Flavihumibacter petaseus]|uniref:Outer membrane protein beta-barrel domain-containing protein n=1 Tax=Flavihumibacter petaseus NBRC 106054 TaxID=1220578 RepID=A0A0E9MTG5_9BACT|nr:outer membrane beta-barrel protein [Flavihumibacter petaseus]GAO41052.1 hypothetical protein FPE01S_01_00640 [Flavihumibacter petaseus NBRC 106054]